MCRVGYGETLQWGGRVTTQAITASIKGKDNSRLYNELPPLPMHVFN